MAQRIVGLDIGTFAVKAVALEVQRELEVYDYREIVLHELAEVDGSVASSEVREEGYDEGPREAGWEAADEREAPARVNEENGEDGEGGDVGVRAVDEGPAWVRAIRLLEAQGFFEEVNRVITSFPNGKAVTLHVEVPFENKVESILPHLLADQLPLPMAQVIYDFVVVPGAEPESFEAFVGVAEKSDMAAFLMAIQESGVDPSVVGVPELMLRYLGDQAIDPGLKSYGVIDLGHDFTRLLIMSDGKPVAARSIRSGGALVTADLAQAFGLSEDDAMRLKHQRGFVGPRHGAGEGADEAQRKIGQAVRGSLQDAVRELRRSFQSVYASYDVAVEGIFVCGGTSRLPGLVEFLHEEFQVPVERLVPGASLLLTQPQTGERVPELAQAMGCALQGPLDVGDANLIDLRQDEFVFRGKSSYLRSQMVRIGAIAAVLFVMMLGVLVLQYLDQRAQLRAMQAALAEQSAELFGEAVRSPAEVTSRLSGQAGPNRAFVPRMSAYELYVEIMDEMTEEIPLRLEQIQIDMGRNLATLIGVTDSPQSVDTFAAGIERMECVTEVRKEGVNVRGDEDVRFELNINNNCS